MITALFPGTFDPPSLGHLDIIKRASKLCDRLIVGVGVNISKKEGFLKPQKKLELLREITKDIDKVEICEFEGLATDFAKANKIQFIVRGLRSHSDMHLEMQMAAMNRKLSGIETVFLLPDEKYGFISSTLIRELAFYHANLGEFVPKIVEQSIGAFKG